MVQEALKQKYKVFVLDNKLDIFFVKQWRKQIIFKNIDCGLNNSLAAKFARFKHLTDFMLAQSWLKAPKFVVIKKADRKNVLMKLQEHWLSFPLVVKPSYGHQWSGVSVNIKNEIELNTSVKLAQKSRSYVMVQEFFQGDDYRVVTVNYKFVAAIKRVPPFVVGDGKKNIRQLIGLINKDPFRWDWHDKSLSHIKIDSHIKNYITDQGFTLNSILPNKKKIFVRKNANLSTWGLSVDVTDVIHPSFKKLCEQAAKTLWLKVAWIDIVTKDISQDIAKQKGWIIEVNCTPGLRWHHFPVEGKPRNVAKKILDLAVKTLW